MKRFNKVLALVLALTMMCGLVSICASAADTTQAAFKVRYVDNDGNAITNVAAGSTVNVILSVKTFNNSYTPLFQAVLLFDQALFTQIRQDGTAVAKISNKNCGQILGRFAETGELEDVSDELLAIENEVAGNQYVNDWGAGGSATMAVHQDKYYPADFTDAQKAQYKCAVFNYIAKGDDSNLCVNTEGEYVDFVRFRFLANADTAVDSSVIYLPDDLAKNYVTIDIDDMPLRNGQTSNPVKVSSMIIEYEGGTPATDVKVNNVDAQVRWANKGANLIDLGFRGQIAEGYDASADKTGEKGVNGGDQLAKLTEVGFYIDNSKVPAYTIYNFVDGGYFYRAVVANVDYQNTDSISAKAYVVIDGKEYTAAEAFTTSAKAEYDEVKSSMEA